MSDGAWGIEDLAHCEVDAEETLAVVEEHYAHRQTGLVVVGIPEVAAENLAVVEVYSWRIA